MNSYGQGYGPYEERSQGPETPDPRLIRCRTRETPGLSGSRAKGLGVCSELKGSGGARGSGPGRP